MKGKGKGAKDQNENKTCPLRFPDVGPTDYCTMPCSTFLSILDQKDEKIMTVDDLDKLQYELETVLLSVMDRQEKIDDDLQLLISWQDKKKRPGAKVEVESSRKKSKIVEAKPTKKAKDNNKGHTSAPVGRPSKNSHNRSQDHDHSDSAAAVPKIQRNDTPNRFWEYLKPYTADITQGQLKFLEEWAKEKSIDDDDDYKIPPLGKHYAAEWSHRDIQEEQKEGAKANEKRSRSCASSSSLSTSDSERIMKRARKEHVAEESGSFGPLTQRLVSTLIEENIMSSQADNIDSFKDLPEEPEEADRSVAKSLNITRIAAEAMEKRIRKNLEIAGILDADEEEKESDGPDEVLAELISVQANLRAVTNYNLELKRKLLRCAKKEFAMQELRKELDVVDVQIRELLKQGELSAKDKDRGAKLLKEREALEIKIEQEENS